MSSRGPWPRPSTDRSPGPCMGESPLHAPVLGSSEAEGTQVSPAHPLRVGLECRPPGLSAKAAVWADPGWKRVRGLTLSSTRCSLSRSWNMWPTSFPRERSRAAFPSLLRSRRCAFQPAPTSPLQVTKDVPARTHASTLVSEGDISLLSLSPSHTVTHTCTHIHTPHTCTCAT